MYIHNTIYVPRCHTLHMALNSNTVIHHCAHTYYIHIHYCGNFTESIYIIQSVCLFVCLFAVNAKTTARIDANHLGITKNDLESVLRELKSPVLVLLGRHCEISGFSFTADCHFYLLSPFHFRLLPRHLAQSTFTKTPFNTEHQNAVDSVPQQRSPPLAGFSAST